MRHQHILHGLLLLAIVWLVLGGTATVVAAPVSGSASPTTAVPGTRVHFHATGFTAGERVDFWASSPTGITKPRYPSVEADTTGAVVWSWDVTQGDANGNWTMSARGIKSGSALAIPFTVVGSGAAPSALSVTPTSGAPRTTFTFTASSLTPGKKAAAWLVEPGGTSRDLVPGEDPGLIADASGALTWSWTAPADAAGGTWQMVVRDGATSDPHIVAFTVTAPAREAAARGVTPASDAPGTSFTVAAGGFTPGEVVGTWLTSPNGKAVDNATKNQYLITDGNGAVTWRWDSPTSAQAGTWQAVSQGRDSRVQVAISFTITLANAAPTTPGTAAGSVMPQSGAPETMFTFTLTGFRKTEKLYYWPTQPDGTVETTRREPISTDGDGKATLEWQAPDHAQSGTWTMTFRGQHSNAEMRISFTIAAAATASGRVSPASGAPGTSFTFQVDGYNVIERLDTWLEQPDGNIILGPKDTARADGNGHVEWTWIAPADAQGGTWTMVAKGQDTERVERISFTIIATAPQAAPGSVSPERGSIGTTFTFTASGFKEGERVGYWLNLPDGSIQRFDHELHADKRGTITWTYTVPADAQHGIYMMAARSSQHDRVDNDVSIELRFTVGD